jgi:hypothetical protein
LGLGLASWGMSFEFGLKAEFGFYFSKFKTNALKLV